MAHAEGSQIVNEADADLDVLFLAGDSLQFAMGSAADTGMGPGARDQVTAWAISASVRSSSASLARIALVVAHRLQQDLPGASHTLGQGQLVIGGDFREHGGGEKQGILTLGEQLKIVQRTHPNGLCRPSTAQLLPQ
jgi:hypothetical protein